MRWLNYHHFLYFWMVVREGGVQPAARRLRLKHPTISAQIKQLEEQLGEPLFDRTHRKLELTQMGRMAYRYADEIFRLGQEFLDAVEQQPTGRPLRLVVGATGAIPKTVVRELLAPALEMEEGVRIECREDHHDRLLGQLAIHELDVVLSDVPVSPTTGVRAFNHLLGECGTTFFAAPDLARQMKGRFPARLQDAPFLAPLPTSALGRALAQWFDEEELRPSIVAEVQDSALIKALGRDGLGFFCLPSVVESEVRRRYGCRVLGRTEDVRERFYAISAERRLKHPAVVAICRTAREQVFA